MAKRAKLHKHIPFFELNKEKNLVITKKGYLLACFDIVMPDLELSLEKQSQISSLFNSWLYKLESNIVIHADYRRIKSKAIKIESDNFLKQDKLLDEDRSDLYNSRAYYSSVLTISISKKAEIDKKGISAISLDAFDSLIQSFYINLASFKYDAIRLKESDLISYLSTCINLEEKKILYPEGLITNLDEFLCSSTIKPLHYPMQVNDYFCHYYTLKAFPSSTVPQILQTLQICKFPLKWINRWISKSRDESYNLLERERHAARGRKLGWRQAMSNAFSSENQAEEVAPDTKAMQDEDIALLALDELGEDDVSFGNLTSTLVIFAKSKDDLAKRSEVVEKLITQCQFSYVNERFSSFNAYLGTLPSDIDNNKRKPILSTKNMADLMLLSKPYEGCKYNKQLYEWTGFKAPHVICKNSIDGSIYYLNLNGNDDVGHTAIIGPTGSGKSTLLNILSSQWTKYPNSRVVIFDKDLSAYPLNKHNDGVFYSPAAYDSEICFQPLKNAKDNIASCLNFIQAICSVQKIEFSAKEREDSEAALMQMQDGFETLTLFHAILIGINKDSKVAIALSSYLNKGAYGQLFDSDSDHLEVENWPRRILFEMNDLLKEGDAVCIPALVYIFSRLEKALEMQVPTLLILDEAWLYLNNPMFLSFIRKWLRTMRKKRVFVIFATQNVNDLEASTIISECHSKIMLANPGAAKEPLRSKYLSWNIESYIIERISIMERKKDYMIIQPEGNVQFDLELTKEQLAMIDKDNSL